MLATNVRSEQKTASPGPTPSARNPRWIAAVPLETATAGMPKRFSNSCSKASRFGPTVDSQFEANASAIYRCSCPLMWGTERRIRFKKLLLTAWPLHVPPRYTRRFLPERQLPSNTQALREAPRPQRPPPRPLRSERREAPWPPCPQEQTRRPSRSHPAPPPAQGARDRR